MEQNRQIDEGILQGIAFVGKSIGPFFRYDPKREEDIVGPAYAAIGQMNVAQAAAAWPFAEADVVACALGLMQEGLDDDLDEDAVTWEYRRLFVGPATKAAPPWGSVYTDKDRVMFGGTWAALHDWLRRVGVAVTDEGGEPEDHIGLMLEMMAWMADERPEILEDFLRLHLLPWSGHFLDLLEREAQHPFFEGLAVLTRASLEGIGEVLDLQVDIPRFYR